MSVKKILSAVLALAMMLTMASFPAFAEDAKIAITANNITIGDPDKGTIDALFDGKTDSTSLYVIKNTYIGSSTVGTTPASANTIIIDLGADYDLSTLNLYWGTTAWGQAGPDAYTLYTAPAAAEGDPVYTAVTNYDGLNAKVQVGTNGSALADHSNITVVKYNKTHETFDVAEDLTGTTARYIKIVLEKNAYRVGLREIEVYGALATSGGEEPEKTAASYTVNYVDAEGNPVADAKTVTDKFVGDEVTETAVAVDGYTVDKETDTITLVDGTNTITFTYTKVETGTVSKLNLTADNITIGAGYSSYNVVSKLFDGITEYTSDGRYVISGTYTGSAITNTPASASTIVIDLGADYDLSTLNIYWGTTQWGQMGPDAYTLYTAPAAAAGEPVYTAVSNYEGLNAKVQAGTNGSALADYSNITVVKKNATHETYDVVEDLTGVTARYIKILLEKNAQRVGLREIEVYGALATSGGGDDDDDEPSTEPEAAKIPLTGANVIPNYTFGWSGDKFVNTDASTLFDGAAATDTEGYLSEHYCNSGNVEAVNCYIEIDLGGVYDLTSLVMQGGSSGYNYSAPVAYDIYVAGVSREYSETPVASKSVQAVGTKIENANKVRTDDNTLTNATGVRYVKIVMSAVARRTLIGEIEVYGTKLDLTAPENIGLSAGSLGGQIRLPEGSVTAGIRFGATIMKDALTEGATYGMFMLPEDLLGGSTLADYVVNDGSRALDVPATRLFAEDECSVTFTAVLVNIPSTSYGRNIVAVPYICVDGEYTFFAEMTRNYTEVATKVAVAYEAGEITLTEDQIVLLEGVIGRTLVHPEVAE